MPYDKMPLNRALVSELIGPFKQELEMCNLTPDEKLLIVTDTGFNPVPTAACFGAGKEIGAEVYEFTIPYSDPWNENTLRSVFGAADLIVYFTTHPLHYSSAMLEALERGARALCAMAPVHVLTRRIARKNVIRRTRAGAELIEESSAIRITSSAGTDLSMEKGDRPGVASYGAADRPGHLDFWGGGFFQTAQIEGTTEGRLVLRPGDQIFHFGRYVSSRTEITFEDGRAVEFDGGKDAVLLERYLDSFNDPKAFMAGHIAVGTDPQARWMAEATQFPEPGGGGADVEAAYGNLQIELGSNNDILFKGNNETDCHLGICTLGSDLYLDGTEVLRDGEFRLEELKS